MKILKFTATGLLFLAGSMLLAQNKPGQVEANKKIIHDFYRYVWEPADDVALMKWLPENYLEHNPRFTKGRTDLANVLKTRRKGQPVKVAEKLNDPPELVIAEADLVTWIFKRVRKDPKDGKDYESFWFDTFRIRNDKIVEHWDGALRN